MGRRVLVLNHFAAPSNAPGGTRHVELFSRLHDWHAVVVASDQNYLTRRRHAERTDGYRAVWSTGYQGNGVLRVVNWLSYSCSALAVGLREERVDLVYASSPHLFAGLAGLVLARARSTPFVLEVRDLWPRVLVDMGQMSADHALYRTLRRLERALYRHAHAIVVLTEGVRDVLVDEEGVTPGRVHVIPNGADTDVLGGGGASRAEVRRRYGLEGFVLVYAGAHGPANGLGLVLDAAAELRQSCPEARFLLVGDGVEKPALVRRARAERLENVTFVDPVPKARMPEILAAADAGLHVLADVPLFGYGVSPNKLYDYMAAGLPVVTNTGGAVAALVSSAGAGVWTAPHELALGVRQLVEAPAGQRSAWGRAGREHLATHYSRDRLARRVEETLNATVAAATGRLARRQLSRR